jgi:hypothetical protein
MPVILASWEAEIGKITIDPISNNHLAWWSMPATQALWKAEIRKIMVPGQSNQKHFCDSHLNGKKPGGE